ncbi:hypothetical protein F5141DRAFT_1067321 [Pisolithus sp. B1]|nr:hypothetical protein F5141DRAFT_1067321 [Pisolithus sp. B1]
MDYWVDAGHPLQTETEKVGFEVKPCRLEGMMEWPLVVLEGFKWWHETGQIEDGRCQLFASQHKMFDDETLTPFLDSLVTLLILRNLVQWLGQPPVHFNGKPWLLQLYNMTTLASSNLCRTSRRSHRVTLRYWWVHGVTTFCLCLMAFWDGWGLLGMKQPEMPDQGHCCSYIKLFCKVGRDMTTAATSSIKAILCK